MGSSLGRWLTERREIWQAAGDPTPRVKSMVLPAASSVPGAASETGQSSAMTLTLCRDAQGAGSEAGLGWGDHPCSKEVLLGQLGVVDPSTTAGVYKLLLRI